ncbi:MAG: hypothetical protein M0R06_06900 [Sphaerochaeta sp.]|nr:hypothetical protein [Sphaerochaeta sp.]
MKDEDRILELYADCLAADCDDFEAFSLILYKCPTITEAVLNGIVARQVERVPEWKVNAMASGKFVMNAAAKVAMLRKLVRMDDPNFAREHAKLRIGEYAPAQDRLPQGNTFNIVMFPSDAKKIIPSDEMRKVIDAEAK